MQDVPKADVVVTNPTHFAVALAYEGGGSAPRVVAKGQDEVAARIREVARENKVPLVENKPLARTLYRTVEIGREIPADLFEAVAQVLAFVYRTYGRRRKFLATPRPISPQCRQGISATAPRIEGLLLSPRTSRREE